MNINFFFKNSSLKKEYSFILLSKWLLSEEKNQEFILQITYLLSIENAGTYLHILGPDHDQLTFSYNKWGKF